MMTRSRLFSLCLSGLLLWSGPLLAQTPPAQGVAKAHPALPAIEVPGALGVNIHFTDAREGELEMLESGGFRVARMDFAWGGTEKAKRLFESVVEAVTGGIVHCCVACAQCLRNCCFGHNIINDREKETMFKLNPFKKSAEEPLKLSLDTIFDYADKDQAHEVIFEPQRVEKPTETEGIPMPVVPAGSVVLFMFYRVGDRLEHRLSFGDVVKEAVVEQLKKYQRSGWHIAFSHTELGEKASAHRV